jgi:hypothetical protein
MQTKPDAAQRLIIKGHIHQRVDPGYSEDSFVFFEGEGWTGTKGEYAIICPYTIDVELPAHYDPVASKVGALQKAKDAITREFTTRLAEINEQISKLQAIEYTPAGERA